MAGQVAAFITTKGHGPGPHRSGWVERSLTVATARTPDLIRAALLALDEAYAGGGPTTYRYRKAGVVLSELRPAGTEQGAMFDEGCEPYERDPEWAEGQARLMETVDALNRRFGKRAVAFAAMGTPSALQKTRDGSEGAPKWEMRRQRMSPRYTTRWDEIATVRT